MTTGPVEIRCVIRPSLAKLILQNGDATKCQSQKYPRAWLKEQGFNPDGDLYKGIELERMTRTTIAMVLRCAKLRI